MNGGHTLEVARGPRVGRRWSGHDYSQALLSLPLSYFFHSFLVPGLLIVDSQQLLTILTIVYIANNHGMK